MASTVSSSLENYPHFVESQNLKPLSIFLVVILALVAYLAYLRQIRVKVSGKSFSRTLLRVKWTIIPLPIVVEGFIGLLKFRNQGVIMLEELVEKYGPTFRIPATMAEMIAVSDPNIIQKILNSTNIGHVNKPQLIFDMIFADNMKLGLLVANGKIWSPHRKAVSKAFTYSALHTYLKYMNDEAKQITKSALLAASNASEKTFENTQMKKLISCYTLKITINIVMGSEHSFLTEDESKEFQDDFYRFKKLLMNRFLHPHQLIPPIWVLHPNKRKLDQLTEKNNQFSLKITNYYREKLSQTCSNSESENNFPEDEAESTPGKVEKIFNKPFECVVEKMIKAGLTNKEISDEISTILNAGFDTTVTSIEFVMFHLASNREHQEMCHLEVDELFGSKSDCEDDFLNMEDLSKLKYLERCILESLRLTPTIPFFLRQLDTPLQIDNEFEFRMETGQIIVIMPWVVHRNPAIYPNPKVFDPDRFLTENVKKRHSYSFIPFSMGMRNCVGWKVALLEMKLFMAYILRNFQMRTTDKLDDVKFMFDLTIKTEKQLNIKFKTRVLK